MKRIFALLLSVVVPLFALVSTTEEPDDENITKITFTWVSSASGTATGQTVNRYTGVVLRVVFNPDDTDAPSDNYDVVITDNNSVDILDGQGANLDSVTTTQISSPFSAVLNSKLRITVTNAGASNEGQVILYFSDDASCSIADSSITGEKLAAELWTELGDSVLANVPDSSALYDSLAGAWQSEISDSLNLTMLQRLTSDDFHNLGGTDANTTYTADGTTLDLTTTEFGVKDHGITYVQIDTGATGFVDVRKFGAAGNGVADDTDEIKAAMLYAHANGGIVLFSGDSTTVYLVSDSVHVRSNVTVFGYGAWVRRAASIEKSVFVVPDGSNNVHFSRIRIDLNVRNQGTTTLSSAILIHKANNTRIEYCDFYNGSYTIRSVYQNYNTVVDHCHFISCYESVMLYYANDCKITNNVSDGEPIFTNIAKNFGGSFSVYNCVGATISGNTRVMPETLYDTTECAAIGISSQSDTTSGIVVTNNVIRCRAAYQFGITQHVSSLMKDVTISNNTISGVTCIGAIEISASNTTVTSNVIDGCVVGVAMNKSGWIDNIVVSGNKISHCTDSGITGSSRPRNSTFSNNSIYKCGTGTNDNGIRLVAGGRDNTVSGNAIRAVLGTGIGFEKQLGGTVIGNAIRDCTVGIYVTADTMATIVSNNIDSTSSYGIMLNGSVLLSCNLNKVYHTTVGINTGGTNSTLTIEGNHVAYTNSVSNSHGIALYNVSYATVVNNTLTNIYGSGIGLYTNAADTCRGNYIGGNNFIANDVGYKIGSNMLRVDKAKNTNVEGNNFYIRHGYTDLSYSGVINISGNSDSTKVHNNTLVADSTSVLDTAGIYVSNEGQDYTRIFDNFISGFRYGINIVNTRATHWIDNNKIVRYTDAYVMGNSIIGRVVEGNQVGIGKEPSAGIELDVAGDITATGTIKGDSLSGPLNGSNITAGTVTGAKMADADHGDFTYASGVASLDANTVHEAEINWGGVDSDSLTEAIRDANIYQSQTFTFLQPDSIREVVTDSLVFYCFDDLSYPNGAKLGKVRITTSAAVTDTIAIYEYSTRAGASIAVIDSFFFSSQQDAESLAVDLDDSDMAADSWLCLDLSMWDATCKTLEVTVIYYIKPGD